MEQGAHRVARGQVRGVDLKPPRQGRRGAEQLLIKPVSPPADRLGDQESRGQIVRDRPETNAGPLDGEEGAQRTEGDTSPDPQAAVPD